MGSALFQFIEGSKIDVGMGKGWKQTYWNRPARWRHSDCAIVIVSLESGYPRYAVSITSCSERVAQFPWSVPNCLETFRRKPIVHHYVRGARVENCVEVGVDTAERHACMHGETSNLVPVIARKSNMVILFLHHHSVRCRTQQPSPKSGSTHDGKACQTRR